MGHPLFTVDAFAEGPFTGNPAAVCLLEEAASEAFMQSVAAEMNLSETAFLHPEDSGYRLRWFTPTVEVALCGHATLASAHVLWETGRLAPTQVARFSTRSGLLTAAQNGDAIVLDFPVRSCTPCETPRGLPEALGSTPVWIGQNGMDFLVQLESEREVRAMRPDHAMLRTLPVRGVIATARANDGPYDFVSRFFAPGAGVPEDPVTGSAHCALGPFWGAKLGKNELLGFQASARGGSVRVSVRGDRVLLGGRALTMTRGELIAS